MSDSIDSADAARALLALYAARAMGRNEAAYITPEGTRRLTQGELVDELRAGGLSAIARRVSRVVIPVGCVLAFIADHGVRWKVIDLRDPAEPEPAAEPSSSARAGVVAGVLGRFAGGAR